MNSKREAYHHGDLRAALLKAGESVLAKTGVQGFSLRAVARDCGVSHSAPAHHFGDAAGLLDALATEGFLRFRAAMEAEEAKVGPDPKARLIAAGRGYLRFAEEAPELLQLMFGTQRHADASQALGEAGRAAFEHLVEVRNAARGTDEADSPEAMADIMTIWSLAHGLAGLMVSGQVRGLDDLTGAQQEAFIHTILSRYL